MGQMLSIRVQGLKNRRLAIEQFRILGGWTALKSD
jgi:hypothetical protein